jgi:hypothetical protein
MVRDAMGVALVDTLLEALEGMDCTAALPVYSLLYKIAGGGTRGGQAGHLPATASLVPRLLQVILLFPCYHHSFNH